MRKFCKKAKGTRGTANSASSGMLQSWRRVSRKHTYLKKVRFFKKNTFFSQNVSMVASWAPAAQGPSHDATFYASWAHPFYFCRLHIFFHFLVLSRCSLLRRDPRTSFFVLFSEGFSDPRVYRSPMYRCSEVFFFCSVEKVRSKDPIRYAAWALPQGPAFACTLTILNLSLIHI